MFFSPDWCGSVDWSVIPQMKGCRFDPQLGHILRLQVRSPVRACMGGNQLMLLSPIHGSLSLPPPLKEAMKKMSSGEG